MAFHVSCPSLQVLERRAQALVKESSDMVALTVDREAEADRLEGERSFV